MVPRLAAVVICCHQHLTPQPTTSRRSISPPTAPADRRLQCSTFYSSTILVSRDRRARWSDQLSSSRIKLFPYQPTAAIIVTRQFSVLPSALRTERPAASSACTVRGVYKKYIHFSRRRRIPIQTDTSVDFRCVSPRVMRTAFKETRKKNVRF